MGQVGKFLHKVSGGYGHYCPGCDRIHIFYTSLPGHPRWTFDGNLEKPTFSPSMRSFTPAHEWEGTKFPEETLCHYHLNGGVLNFLPDSSGHALRGPVPLPPLPDRFSDDKYGWPE